MEQLWEKYQKYNASKASSDPFTSRFSISDTQQLIKLFSKYSSDMGGVIKSLKQDVSTYKGISQSKIFHTFDKFYPKLKSRCV